LQYLSSVTKDGSIHNPGLTLSVYVTLTYFNHITIFFLIHSQLLNEMLLYSISTLTGYFFLTNIISLVHCLKWTFLRGNWSLESFLLLWWLFILTIYSYILMNSYCFLGLTLHIQLHSQFCSQFDNIIIPIWLGVGFFLSFNISHSTISSETEITDIGQLTCL